MRDTHRRPTSARSPARTTSDESRAHRRFEGVPRIHSGRSLRPDHFPCECRADFPVAWTMTIPGSADWTPGPGTRMPVRRVKLQRIPTTPWPGPGPRGRGVLFFYGGPVPSAWKPLSAIRQPLELHRAPVRLVLVFLLPSCGQPRVGFVSWELRFFNPPGRSPLLFLRAPPWLTQLALCASGGPARPCII